MTPPTTEDKTLDPVSVPPAALSAQSADSDTQLSPAHASARPTARDTASPETTSPDEKRSRTEHGTINELQQQFSSPTKRPHANDGERIHKPISTEQTKPRPTRRITVGYERSTWFDNIPDTDQTQELTTDVFGTLEPGDIILGKCRATEENVTQQWTRFSCQVTSVDEGTIYIRTKDNAGTMFEDPFPDAELQYSGIRRAIRKQIPADSTPSDEPIFYMTHTTSPQTDEDTEEDDDDTVEDPFAQIAFSQGADDDEEIPIAFQQQYNATATRNAKKS